MAVRSTMAALILSVRTLINDTGSPPIFQDQDIQDVMDEARLDYRNLQLIEKPTFSGTTIQFLDYWSDVGGWEDGYTLKQYLVTTVTPSVLEPIAGHWQFAASTLPPIYLSGSLHDRYRAAADLLERLAARWQAVNGYDFSSDGQSFRRSQAAPGLLALAKQYRMKQRPRTIIATRSDLVGSEQNLDNVLAPHAIDYMASGQGS